MRVAIAGGHGKVGGRLIRLLVAEATRSARWTATPSTATRSARGSLAGGFDLEQASEGQVATAIDSVDAVVFAAGAGPGSGPERKWTMDHEGAVKLIAGAKAAASRAT